MTQPQSPSTGMHSEIEELQNLYTEVLQVYEKVKQEQLKLEASQALVKNFPPGHFYSPIPSLAEIKAYEETLSKPLPQSLPGINLNIDSQIQLLKELEPYPSNFSYFEQKHPSQRYYAINNYFPHVDAIILNAMMRHLKPRKIIEIGSGFSSCVMLDTNDQYLKNQVNMTFIEPNPERLKSVLSPADLARNPLLEKQVQEVDLAFFSQLEPNDILFIDSSHVSKLMSDVNYIYFNILQALQPGVYIHIHDILYPFNYTPNFFQIGMFLNEAYFLQAFLTNNAEYSIQLFPDYMYHFYRHELASFSKACGECRSGSLWLRKEAI